MIIITPEFLEYKHAPDKVITYCAQKFPDGATVSDLIAADADMDLIHWCFNNCAPGENDRKNYITHCNNKNCTGIYFSHNCRNSDAVSYSADIVDSREVNDSIKVTSSESITSGRFVNNSDHIYASEFVSESSFVVNSKNITNCEGIYGVTYAENSRDLYLCNSIIESRELHYCSDMTECMFCGSCSHLKHSLFCVGENGGEYKIFNTQVSEQVYKNIVAQFKAYYNDIVCRLRGESYDDIALTTIKSAAELWKTIGGEMLEWIRTLPGYNSLIAYSIFLNPDFLEAK